MSHINIVYSNINSYTRKKQLINNYIENNNVGGVMFVESKTNENSSTAYRDWDVIQYNGYQLHNHTRGGSLVQMQPELRMGKANAPIINNPLNECIHFTIPFLDDKLHIFLVYIHPHSRIEENIFTKSTLYKYSLIVGDFNIGSRIKKKQLNDFIKNTNFSKYDTPPTFIMPQNNDSTPDILLYSTNIKNNLLSVEVIPDLCSDHLSFKITIDMQKPISCRKIVRYNFNNTNINEVNKTMVNYIQQIEGQAPDQQQIFNFNLKLSQAVLQNTPKTEVNHYTQELPPFIIRLIKVKRKMYRDYRKDGNHEIKAELNKYNKNIQLLIQEYRQHQWISICEEINHKKGKTYWSDIRKLTKYKNKSKSYGPLKENGQVYETNEEKASLFAKQFKETYKKSQEANFNDNHYAFVNNWYDTYMAEVPTHRIDHKIDETEYFEIINQGKNTAPGHDHITKNIVRQLDYRIHLYIIKIYEYCIKYCYFPEEWKVGTIVTIAKPNLDHTKPNNYRPITLLPVIGKNLEKLIKHRIQESIGHTIPNYQFGFKSKCSTIHPLAILINNVETCKLNNNKTAALFMDISKAFDSVWHRGLIFKLHHQGCPRYLVLLINNLLQNRKLKVKIQTIYSEEFTPEQGLPQGSPLSPLLYNIYCSDIYSNDFEYFSQEKYVLQYADDTALVSHGNTFTNTIEKLQDLTNKTITWFNKWRLKPNPEKSHLIIFYHTPSGTSPTLRIYNHIIRPETYVKYLGISIDHKINFNYHTKNIKKSIISRAKHFRCLSWKNNGINQETKCKIYKLICRPMIEYGHIVFLNLKHPALQNLKVAETSSIRSITKIRHPNNPIHHPPNDLLYRTTSIQPIEDRLAHLSHKFCQRPENKELIAPFCVRRDPHARNRYKHPEHTIWEKIQTY